MEAVLAGVPAAPSSGPQRVAAETNATHITVQTLLTTPDLNGGSLKRLHLQMDNGGDGKYRDLIGPEAGCLDTILTVSSGIEKGKTYMFRYRIMNENGWSDFSPVTLITAASYPSSPALPQLSSASATSLTLSFTQPEFDGGAPLTSYQLFVNDCTGSSEPTTQVTGYSDNSMGYSVAISEIPSLTGGEICTWRFRATNSEGYYEDSGITIAAFADTASKPSAPYAVAITETSITITWDAVAGTQSPGGNIRGYRVYMRKVNGGEKSIVYEKLSLSSTRTYTASGLETGAEYDFSVQAYQLNGFTEESDPVTLKACGVPSILYPPRLVSGSATQLALKWDPPLSCGGCAVLGYALFMDDGNGGALSEIDSGTIRNNPELMEHTVSTFPAGSLGNTFVFQLKVFTEGGETESEFAAFPLASVPGTPSSAPVADTSVSTSKVIKVDVAAASDNGGSAVVSYSIEVDDGAGGVFSALYGTTVNSLSTTYTLTAGIVEGNTYRFRYRVKNLIGWSDYSPVAYIKAVSIPDAPPSPEFISSTDSTIRLQLRLTTENHGALIYSYELYRDEGTSGSAFQKVTSYSGSDSTFDLTTTIDPALVAGLTYLFKLRAFSEAGYSDFSATVAAPLARVPAQLPAPTQVLSSSNRSRIVISWVPQVDRDSPAGNVLRFKVFMAKGLGTSFAEVLTTSGSSVTTFAATGLTPGMLYRFKVVAINLAGTGLVSDVLSVYA